MMTKQRRIGKIIFVASFLSYVSFAGYSSYSPAKYALRGLSDALRSEMLLHNIDIHIFLPCGITGPGFDAENRTKPAVTKKIEEGDTPITPELCAAALESGAPFFLHLCKTKKTDWSRLGLKKGYYQITDNLVTEPIRLRSNGGVPTNNFFLDTLWLIIGSVGVPIWRMTADSTVRSFRPKVEKELQAKGYYVS